MKPYQALIWNEWRQMRGMFLAAAGAMILLFLTLFILNMLRVRDIDMVALVISCLLPGLLALIGFWAFQGELKSQTDSFLLALPISRGRIFLYKYLFNLSIYIVLAALCCALFFPLTLDRGALAKISARSAFINVTTIVFTMSYLFAHAMSITAPLINNSRGGKAGGWAVFIAFPALFIGIQAIVALYPCNEMRWTGVSIFMINLILWIFALAAGYHLWTNYLALKRNVMRPLFKAAGMIIVISALLFTTAYIYSGMDLSAARREALTAGLKLETKPAPELTPETLEDAARISDALQKYQLRLDAVKPKLPSQTGTSFHGGYTWRSGAANIKARRQAADFILGDASAVKLYADLLQILNKPACRFDGTSLVQKFPGTDFWPTEIIRNFLHDRAFALELNNRTPEAFACLDLLDKLADAVGYSRNGMGWFGLSKLKIVVNIGPDTMAGVEYYEKLLKELAATRPEFNDDTVAKLKYSDDAFRMSRGPLRPFLEIGAFLLRPRYHESIANLLRWQVAYKQLFERSETVKFAEAKPDMLKLSQSSPIIISISPYQIQQCYTQRGHIANMQLYLALKIYKAKYGHFPNTLAQLAPEILPVVPLSPITGENFKYHADPNGFSLQTESFLLTSKKIEPVTYSYRTWDKTAPEAEEPALPQNKRRRAPAPELTNTKEKTK